MSNSKPFEYRGCSIFRKQPNHSYFDKPFEDEEDCWFLYLKDIDPFFLKPGEAADILTNTILTDPRTRKPIKRLCYDYTKEDETKIFDYDSKSLLTETQHKLGVDVLNRLQDCLEVEEEDMYNWYRMQKTRLRENQNFQKFVLQFSLSNKDHIYAPCIKLLELYQNWYKNKVFRLMQRYPDDTYNTHLGLPNVEQCKNPLSDQQVEMTNQEIVCAIGNQCVWRDDAKEELVKFNHTISAYAEVFNNSEDLKETLEDNLKLKFVKLVEQELGVGLNFYIPLESLIFLLTAGDYIDMPTELLLNIKETQNGSNKYILMDLPLPSRQGGWHTYEQIVEQAAIAMFSLKETNCEKVENCTNFSSNKSFGYRVSTLEEFMRKSKVSADKHCKFSKTLTKWHLSNLEDMHLQLYTSMDSLADNNSVFIKLEYKATLGCEVLTKCEILKEWFKLKLLGSSKSNCLRLDATNYKIMLEEALKKRKLEERLSSLYDINCNQLLTNLFEFLNMLFKMPLGHYMLRYNPKFKNKLMLCTPSKEITRNTIYLHKLLNSNVTNTEFMTQNIILPIDENLCGLMHSQHKILPATFCPRAKANKRISNQPTDSLLEAEEGKKNVERRTINRTRIKRTNRKRREFAKIADEKKDFEELNREMELDRKMLNF